jgi:hypothetical protein
MRQWGGDGRRFQQIVRRSRPQCVRTQASHAIKALRQGDAVRYANSLRGSVKRPVLQSPTEPVHESLKVRRHGFCCKGSVQPPEVASERQLTPVVQVLIREDV